jgi:hypothetical protein
MNTERKEEYDNETELISGCEMLSEIEKVEVAVILLERSAPPDTYVSMSVPIGDSKKRLHV